MVESGIGAIENVGFRLLAGSNFAQEGACISYDIAPWLNPNAQILVVLILQLVDLTVELPQIQQLLLLSVLNSDATANVDELDVGEKFGRFENILGCFNENIFIFLFQI